MGMGKFTKHDSRRYHVMHSYIYVRARFSYSNEILQNINFFAINQKYHYMQWLAICAATRPFLSVHQLV